MMTDTLYRMASEAGIEATQKQSEGCAQLADGSYGPIVTTSYVHLVARDPSHGTVVVKRLPSMDTLTVEIVAAAIREMRAEVKGRGAQTRARIRAEEVPS